VGAVTCCSDASPDSAGDFDVRLLVYSKQALLPAGSPGDPAADYTAAPGLIGMFRGCGVREKVDDIPYAGKTPFSYVVDASCETQTLLGLLSGT
jgi:hypothetical protein